MAEEVVPTFRLARYLFDGFADRCECHHSEGVYATDEPAGEQRGRALPPPLPPLLRPPPLLTDEGYDGRGYDGYGFRQCLLSLHLRRDLNRLRRPGLGAELQQNADAAGYRRSQFYREGRLSEEFHCLRERANLDQCIRRESASGCVGSSWHENHRYICVRLAYLPALKRPSA